MWASIISPNLGLTIFSVLLMVQPQWTSICCYSRSSSNFFKPLLKHHLGRDTFSKLTGQDLKAYPMQSLCPLWILHTTQLLFLFNFFSLNFAILGLVIKIGSLFLAKYKLCHILFLCFLFPQQNISSKKASTRLVYILSQRIGESNLKH